MKLRNLIARLGSLAPPDPAAPLILPGTDIDTCSTVGAYTYIGKNCRVTRATIGRYCSIGDLCIIGPGEHLTDRVSTSTLLYDENPFDILTRKPCTLGHDVWLGCQVTIRRGVTVGTGAVVGAHAFVNRDVPPFAIVAGVPARLVRYRFTVEQIAAIEASQWWNQDLREAREILRTLEHESPPR